jgi:D-3-phosphoglycerate dehydrogenase / 2-oxoglutarate reductase
VTRVLAAGDHFVAPHLFDTALRGEPGLPDDLDVAHLTAGWPTEPFGPVGTGDQQVEEASGTEDGLVAALDGARVCLTQMAPFTARVFDASPGLEMVAVCRGGPVNVDLAAADRAGVAVTQAPGRNAAAAAEYAVGMALAALRRIPLAAAELREGRWRGDFYAYDEAGLELDGATVGLVGYGAIGRIVARVLHAFGASVLVADPYTDRATAEADGVRLVELDELLRSSSVVSLHARLSDETRGMIGARELDLMPDGAVLVNTARGGLLDHAPLPEALRSGRLGGLALDVFDVEPPPDDWPLHDAPNVVATPHLAGATRQTAHRAAAIAAGEAARFLRGEALRHPANDTARRRETQHSGLHADRGARPGESAGVTS